MGWFTDLRNTAQAKAIQAGDWAEQKVDTAVDWVQDAGSNAIDYIADKVGWDEHIQGVTSIQQNTNFNWDTSSLSAEQGVKDFATPFVKLPSQTVIGIAQDINTYHTEGGGITPTDIAHTIANRVYRGMGGPVGFPKQSEYDPSANIELLLYDMNVQNETAWQIAEIFDLVTNPDRWEFE